MSEVEVIEVYLFPQRIDGLLNVGEVHGLNIADDWHNEPLQRTVTFRSNVKQSATTDSRRRSKVGTFGVATATLMST